MNCRKKLSDILMDAPIFIVGPHRGGSTLWHNLMAMCPGILRLAEPRFIGPPRQKDFRFFLKTHAGDLSKDENIDRMVELCFSKKPVSGLEGAFWRFVGIEAADNPALREKITRKIKSSDKSLGAIARIVIDELTYFSSCNRACVKFPVEVRHIPELVEWFPNCRIVHITRDPRGLAMSKSNDPSGTALKVRAHPRLAWFFRKAAVSLVIAQYRLSATVHQRFQKLSNYRLFRYEDLLADPESVIRDLCDFTGIEFSDDMLEPQKSRHEHQPSSLTGRQQKAFDPEAALRWQAVISPIDNLIILALTKRSMKHLGYDPVSHPIFRKAQRVSQGVQHQGAF